MSSSKMDEIKKERIKKDIHEKNQERLLKWQAQRAQQDYTKIIREMSWPKYMLAATVMVGIGLVLNLPLVRFIHYNEYLTEQVDLIMKRFISQMDEDDRRFQKNLLHKFRTEKNMQVKNVTSDDLKSSKFFDN